LRRKKEDIDAIPGKKRSEYILQERLHFEPVIETPFGGDEGGGEGDVHMAGGAEGGADDYPHGAWFDDGGGGS
jgi:hypothetical protein